MPVPMAHLQNTPAPRAQGLTAEEGAGRLSEPEDPRVMEFAVTLCLLGMEKLHSLSLIPCFSFLHPEECRRSSPEAEPNSTPRALLTVIERFRHLVTALRIVSKMETHCVLPN